jgi:hypothetical protein
MHYHNPNRTGVVRFRDLASAMAFAKAYGIAMTAKRRVR